jgi:hypothetical protein
MKTAPTIEIEASHMAAALRLAGGLAATALFVAVACHVIPPTDDVLDLMIGGVGTAAALLWSLVAAWRLATLRGPIVTIAPQGIRDRRIAGEMVPWSAVADISTREDSRHKEMVLWVDPVLERRLTRTWWARLRRDADRRRGELCVTAMGLRTSHETLLATTRAYLEAWRESRR